MTFSSRDDAWRKLAHECALGAIYDSAERQPHTQCDPGTRDDVLSMLKALVSEASPDDRKIVWIVGERCSGKTTIAHTFADQLRREGKLLGTFFFSRNHDKRKTYEYVYLTLAYQLGLQHHRLKEAIAKAIFDDPGLLLKEKSRDAQLDKLVVEPLRQMSHVWRRNNGMSIIIDGLEKGAVNSTQYIKPFLCTLAALTRDPSLPICNIVISSRPTIQVTEAMNSDDVTDMTQVLRIDVESDIDSFVEHKLKKAVHSHSRLIDGAVSAAKVLMSAAKFFDDSDSDSD